MSARIVRIVGLVLFGSAMFLGGLSAAAYILWPPPPGACSADYVDAWETIKAKHVGEPVTDDRLRRGAIKGMIQSLGDRHSRFLDPEQAKRDDEEMSGKFVGIGAILDAERAPGKVMVVETIEDSPAEKSGVLAGDLIVAVDGLPVAGEGLDRTISRIRGPEATDVRLTIERAGRAAAVDITVTRGEVRTKSVRHELLRYGGKEFMLIKVSSFGNDTDRLFSAAAKQAYRSDVAGVILDLRDNGGGRIDAAILMACRWQSAGPLVYEVQRDGKREPGGCNGSPYLAGRPTVVLVNGHTASASEIVTGALQDYGQAYVIGEKTFGKGCGQNGYKFKDGSKLWLTTFLWQTPKGRSIHKKGLVPDEIVAGAPEGLAACFDPQLERAFQYLSAGN